MVWISISKQNEGLSQKLSFQCHRSSLSNLYIYQQKSSCFQRFLNTLKILLKPSISSITASALSLQPHTISLLKLHHLLALQEPPKDHNQMASTCSLYEVLGIPMSAGGHEIKAAYRRLARTCHPDVVSINQKEISTNEFMKIQVAYSTLSDPDKRANYDRNLHVRLRRFGSSLRSATMAAASGFSYNTGRNWETDQCW